MVGKCLFSALFVFAFQLGWRREKAPVGGDGEAARCSWLPWHDCQEIKAVMERA